MPTFIDESGETGHSRGSLPYFRLAAVWMPDRAVTDSFREDVRQLRQRLNLGASFEFKFTRTHCHPDRAHAFFGLSLHHQFSFSVCAIDKTKGSWRNAPSREQHWAAATSLASCLRRAYHQAERPERPLRDPILVDDNRDPKFLAAIHIAFHCLKSQLHPGLAMVLPPRFRDSQPDEVMQLVDMVCGATGAAIDGNPTWYNFIKGRCLGLICLP